MVRAVKSKSTRSLGKGESAVLLPGSTGAEPWGLWFLGAGGSSSSAELIQNFATPLENRIRKNTVLALPVSQVFCLPLWLNETDAKQFPGMITLQLELRGLQPRGTEPAVFDWTVVAQEEARTLVMIGVLPATLPPEMHVEVYEAFDVSARLLPFAENALTIWKEQDRLAMAVTRDKNLVYYQAQTEGSVSARVAQDIACAHSTLAMQGIVEGVSSAVFWTETSNEEQAALYAALPLPIRQEEFPAPVAPVQRWKLTPSVVGDAQKVRASRRWQMRAAAILLVLYLAVVTWLAAQFVVTSRKADELRKWQADNSAALDMVHEGRAMWKDLAPVVDTKSYPLELLYQASQSIPLDQLHLTLFETGNGRLLIKGEAKNIEGAYQFWNKLKTDPSFTPFNTEMPIPPMLPNGLAKFQITGTHASH